MRTRQADERGSTLIEMLFALVLLGTAASAVLMMLNATLAGSAEHRTLASLNTLLEDYASSVEYQVELAPPDASASPPTPLYIDCPTPSASSATYVLQWYQQHVTFNYPASDAPGYSVRISAVAPWNSSTGSFDPNCPTAGVNNDANGLQKLTLEATSASGQQESLEIVVRSTAFSANDANAGF